MTVFQDLAVCDLLSVADDIVILAHGALAGTFRRGEITAEDVMTLVSR